MRVLTPDFSLKLQAERVLEIHEWIPVFPICVVPKKSLHLRIKTSIESDENALRLTDSFI